ncbi:TRAP transporter large permease subunit [Sinorhizobium medicae]|uniref:TRAP transporter large permease protein n=2 Tax=Sinorhizobium medicae TaxID=110321 RepID=A0A508X0G8_9HYPH|nr:TRAP transporter large permease [Sinorhizobium medicae]ABR62646.1 TRAP dicarboxylate transporter, DctM subunit [Sinorhizobium medicae WSM419]MDX0406803.1 TRAP transporter large permease subunit [Sinorhizobium medicae]MDX0412351.1 TRAP transporter large permease subunit [Sinorhizobium medicae]MDX0418513.1 TRAP transporter large permease subunit [Sinorhizobium medicae]MDX0431992.1 TRAP transporter large permease subunit [Sinorhizobium medicae]
MTTLFGGWFALLVAGMPVGFTLIVAALAYMLWQGTGLNFAGQRMIAGLNSFPLLAVPFFILTAQLMNLSGVTERIFAFAKALVGHVRGGLGHVNIMASVMFSGMSGSAVADAAGLGQLEIKAMRDAGYDEQFSGSVTAASAIIGPLIPPSIPLVVYGVIANTSIGGLFLGGIVPGLLCAISLMVMVYVIAWRRNYPTEERSSLRRIWSTFWRALLPLITPFIIIGGIFAGIFSPTEAAVVAASYALFLGVVVYREITFAKLVIVLRETVSHTAAVGLLIMGVSLFGYVIAREQVPQHVAAFFLAYADDPLTFLILVNLMLLALGTFIEALAILLLIVPVLVPTALQFGVDPVHFGVMVVFNLMIGILTPPMGVALFVVSKVADIPFGLLARGILPLLVPLVLVLVLITLFPALVTFIPDQMLGAAR